MKPTMTCCIGKVITPSHGVVLMKLEGDLFYRVVYTLNWQTEKTVYGQLSNRKNQAIEIELFLSKRPIMIYTRSLITTEPVDIYQYVLAHENSNFHNPLDFYLIVPKAIKLEAREGISELKELPRSIDIISYPSGLLTDEFRQMPDGI